jgi:hypothetical protein
LGIVRTFPANPASPVLQPLHQGLTRDSHLLRADVAPPRTVPLRVDDATCVARRRHGDGRPTQSNREWAVRARGVSGTMSA